MSREKITFGIFISMPNSREMSSCCCSYVMRFGPLNEFRQVKFPSIQVPGFHIPQQQQISY